MHDLRALRADPDGFDAALARRGLPPAAATLLVLDKGRRDGIAMLQDEQMRRNALSRAIGERRRTGQDTAALEAEVASLRNHRDALQTETDRTERLVRDALAALPNRLDPDVPPGTDDTGNIVLKQVGEPPAFGFPLREHFELGERLGLMDFEAAARIAGSRFTILRGALARLERALGGFMLDLHTGEHGYTEISPPLLVNEAAAFGTNQLPKFREDLFETLDGRFLIPTAEVPLTNLVSGQIVPVADLPIRVTALTDCFRREAGSAGRDTRGMLRQHQFRKVELVSVTAPDASDAEHERMTRAAETVLERLGLVYRRVLLCAGDTGFGAAKTFDLEVWLPGQGAWREISSCSNTRDFQARRMNARLRGADGKPAGFVNTLNGSGIAVGRALIAVMETYQDEAGGIRVPEALVPYMAGLERIGP
jgi:seryl-tRNA synthetase